MLNKYLIVVVSLFVTSANMAQDVTLTPEGNNNEIQGVNLCNSLKSIMLSPGSHNITISGHWLSLVTCQTPNLGYIRVSDSIQNVIVNAEGASFTASSDIRGHLFEFKQVGGHVTNFTWVGGSFDTTEADITQLPDNSSLHNVGSSLGFSEFKDVIVKNISVNGGVDTSEPRGNSPSYYDGGDSGVTGGNNTYMEVRDSYFTGLGDAGVYLGGVNDRGKIYVHDNVFISNNIGAVFKRRAKNVVVSHNLFIRNISGVITADVIDEYSNVLYGAIQISIKDNIFIKTLSKAVDMKNVIISAVTYRNQIYGLGRIDSNVQNTYVRGIIYRKSGGTIRLNTVYPKFVPDTIAFNGNIYHENDYTPPSMDSTTAVFIEQNELKSVNIHHNNLMHTRVGVELYGTKDVNFKGNIKSSTFGFKLTPKGGLKTTGSKLTVGLLDVVVGLSEYKTNGGANPKNEFCAVLNNNDSAAGAAIHIDPYNSTTDSRLRIGISNLFRHYIGRTRQAHVTTCIQ